MIYCARGVMLTKFHDDGSLYINVLVVLAYYESSTHCTIVGEAVQMLHLEGFAEGKHDGPRWFASNFLARALKDIPKDELPIIINKTGDEECLTFLNELLFGS
jgi:hypothetical protein